MHAVCVAGDHICWLQTESRRERVCVLIARCAWTCVCVFWLRRNADETKQEIGFLAPSIISLSLSVSFFPFGLTRFIWVSPSLLSFLFLVSHHCPWSFSHTVYFLFWICHWTIEFHTQHSYAWQVTFSLFIFSLEARANKQSPSVCIQLNQRQFGFIKQDIWLISIFSFRETRLLIE